MLKLKKGDIVIYNGSMPFKLGNGQEVSYFGEELLIASDVVAQKEFFEKKVVKEVKLEDSKSPKKEDKKELNKKEEDKKKNK